MGRSMNIWVNPAPSELLSWLLIQQLWFSYYHCGLADTGLHVAILLKMTRDTMISQARMKVAQPEINEIQRNPMQVKTRQSVPACNKS